MVSTEQHLKRIDELKTTLEHVKTIAARGGNYEPLMVLLETMLPHVAEEKVTLERAQAIEQSWRKSKDELSVQQNSCNEREAAITAKETVLTERYVISVVYDMSFQLFKISLRLVWSWRASNISSSVMSFVDSSHIVCEAQSCRLSSVAHDISIARLIILTDFICHILESNASQRLSNDRRTESNG